MAAGGAVTVVVGGEVWCGDGSRRVGKGAKAEGGRISAAVAGRRSGKRGSGG